MIGFERVVAKAGQRMEVNFVFGVPKSLGIVDYTGYKLYHQGYTRSWLEKKIMGSHSPFKLTLRPGKIGC